MSTPTTKSNFADNMARARKHFAMTQEQAAAAIKIKRSTLASYEEGRAQPTLDVFNRICLVYKIASPLHFITGTFDQALYVKGTTELHASSHKNIKKEILTLLQKL